jgi:aspartyl-tRNA(Asn)/glutamyl-tRNA(Gln) amidotransferase subunit A
MSATADADLCERPLSEVSGLIAGRKVSSFEVTDAVLRRIDRHGPRLNCYITVLADEARARARAMDDAAARGGKNGPLHGIPISLKDNIETAGIRTTAGSSVLWDNVPTRTATVARRLHGAGTVLVAKANLHEFAYGFAHPRFGMPVNPWRPGYIPGGSSSGSGSAVAAGLCYGSIGSDTGGSIRVPAALCGTVGLKATYGLVSRAGIFPLSYNLDAAGPMTRTVRDAALMLQVIAGQDPDDPHTTSHPIPDYTAHIEDGVRSLTIGIPDDASLELLDDDGRAALDEVCRVLEREGARLQVVQLPDLAVAQLLSEIIIGVEASEYHRRTLRTTPHLFGPTVRLRLERNEFIPATDYVHAQRVRQRFIVELRESMRDIHALITPAQAAAAYPVDTQRLTIKGKSVEAGPAISRYTRLFNLTGNPALVLPSGFDRNRLPIGLQIIAHPFDEVMMFRVARAYERATQWHRARPNLNALHEVVS